MTAVRKENHSVEVNIRVENWVGHEVRFAEIEPGEWGGVLTDICKALGLKIVARALKGLRSDGVHSMNIIDRLGRQQNVNVIDERNIYLLIFKSRKKEAIQFQDWVFDIIRKLRQSTGLEGFQIFRMLDKDHQKEAMSKLCTSLQESKPINHIRANTITNKAVSLRFGYKKMLKKHEMTPDMLVERQPILEDTVGLMIMKSKFDLDVSVSEKIYEKYPARSKMA